MKSKYKFNLFGENFDCGDDYILIYPHEQHKYTKIRTDEFWVEDKCEWWRTGESRNFSNTLTYRRKK